MNRPTCRRPVRGIEKKEFEGYDIFTLRPVCIDIFIGDRSEYVATPLRSADQHVQSSFSAIIAQRPEPHGEEAFFIATTPHRDEDDVTFIAMWMKRSPVPASCVEGLGMIRGIRSV